MTTVVVRKRKLGKTSVSAIVAASEHEIVPILYSNKTERFQDHANPRRPATFPRDADLVFRWGCTANIPGNPTIVNEARAIHAVSDKLGFRRSIAALQPHWAVISTAEGVRTHFRDNPTVGLVLRPVHHHQGRNLHVAANLAQASDAIRRIGNAFYAAPLVNKVAEYRVFVANGRCIAVARKTPGNPDQVAWNVAQGGRFDNVRFDDWPLKAVKQSIAAFLTTGLDFGGVDVMVDGEGEVYILEINSAPSLTSEYRQQCMAKAFDWIIQHGKDVVPLTTARGGWRKFVHPCINENATV